MEREYKREMGENQVEIALLGGDMELAREWGQVFRKVGIVPHLYTSLEDFWQGTLKSAPHLALVDVRQLSQGTRELGSHPLVESQKLALSFYCSPQTAPLLYPVYEIFNLGVVWGGVSLPGQIKNILQRFNQWNDLKSQASLWRKHGASFEEKLSRAVEDSTSLKEQDFYRTLFQSLCKRFEALKNSSLDFEHACARAFESVPEISQFSTLELNPNGQKLISPQRELAKYKPIPALWLGQACRQGIEFFAQNLAGQVCLEVMGGELMSLLIGGRRENPDKMLFVRTQDLDFFHQFDWPSFERYLAGLFAWFQWRDAPGMDSERSFLTPWEVLNLVAQEKEQEKKWAIIGIDFGNLLGLAHKQKALQSFDWHTSFTDFFCRLQSEKEIKFQLCGAGLERALVVVERENFERAFTHAEKVCGHFPFWRYFENGDAALETNLRPRLRELPLSCEAILRYSESGDYLPKKAPLHAHPPQTNH